MLAGRDSTTQSPRTLEQLLPPSLSARLDALDLLSRKVLAGKLPGERRSKRRGRSVEFDDFRQYVAGDDLRHVDWNIMGRLDKLFIKLFREEEDLSLQLVIDASPSMDVGSPNKLMFAMQLAMALGYVGLVNHNRVSAAVFGVPIDDADGLPTTRVGLRQLMPMRGRMNTNRLADFLLTSLNAVQRKGGVGLGGIDPLATFNDAMHSLAKSSAARSGGRGITLIISDFLFDSVPVGLRYLSEASGQSLDTYAVQVLSPGELDPAMLADDGLIGDLRLTDIESGHAREVTVTPATISVYRRALDKSVGALRDECAHLAIAHFLVNTSTPIEDLVVTTLRRGGMLR